MSKKARVFLQTFGCQMNTYDTEVAEGILEHEGYELVRSETFPITRDGSNRRVSDGVDIFLMNTCSVREHAEDRVYGRLGLLGKVKKTNPDVIVGLMGCMVEEHKEALFKRFPQLDLMVGTRNIKELPLLIDEVKKSRKQVARIKQEGISIEYTDLIKRAGTYHAWLPIMTGCNKVCTYCIVPITRGAEVSMPAREIFREVSRLVEEGVRWITLLGQNVNSYRGGEGDSKSFLFPELLEMLCEIEGLERISFTTSHPQDATEELFRVIQRQEKISRRFHLPLQTGSNRMLKRMARLHTYEDYRDKIKCLRQIVPEIAITTDIIAGFSGETEEDHEQTKAALRELRFDGAYIYKYSVRPGTPAHKLTDDVAHHEKKRRNAELIKVQKEVTRENDLKRIGHVLKVFVEGVGTKLPGQLICRTEHDRKVVLTGKEHLIGTFQEVKILDVYHETFFGSCIN